MLHKRFCFHEERGSGTFDGIFSEGSGPKSQSHDLLGREVPLPTHVKTVNLAPFLLYVTAKTLTALVLVLLFFPHDNLKDEQDEGENANKDEKVAKEEELAVHVERRPQAQPKLSHLLHGVHGCE